MGTSDSATWLLSGTSGGLFRVGIQALDSNGTIRVYSNSSYVTISGSTITGTLAGNATTVTNGVYTNDSRLSDARVASDVYA